MCKQLIINVYADKSKYIQSEWNLQPVSGDSEMHRWEYAVKITERRSFS